MQRVGAPVEPIICMLTSIQKLQHQIGTVFGDSEMGFSGALYVVPIQGVGQGNGVGPQIWAVVSTPVINMLQSLVIKYSHAVMVLSYGSTVPLYDVQCHRIPCGIYRKYHMVISVKFIVCRVAHITSNMKWNNPSIWGNYSLHAAFLVTCTHDLVVIAI